MLLLIIGIFVFSALTGEISSFFTDKILDIDSDVEENLDILNRKVDNLDREITSVRRNLELFQLRISGCTIRLMNFLKSNSILF